MPTDTLLPASVGTDDQWGLGAGANKTVAVQTADGDTSYIIIANAVPRAESYNHDQLSASAVEITTQTIYNTSRRSIGNTDYRYNRLLYAAAYSNGACTNPTAIYTEKSDTDMGVPGGGTWTPAIVNATEIVVRTCNTGLGHTVRCTQLKWDVTYTEGGGFMMISESWLPPLIAMGSLFGNYLKAESVEKLENTMIRILRNLKTKPAIKYEGHEEEKEAVYDMFFYRPKFVFLGG